MCGTGATARAGRQPGGTARGVATRCACARRGTRRRGSGVGHGERAQRGSDGAGARIAAWAGAHVGRAGERVRERVHAGSAERSGELVRAAAAFAARQRAAGGSARARVCSRAVHGPARVGRACRGGPGAWACGQAAEVSVEEGRRGLSSARGRREERKGGGEKKMEKEKENGKKGKEKKKKKKRRERGKEIFAVNLSAATTTPVGHARRSRPRAAALAGSGVRGSRGTEGRNGDWIRVSGQGKRFRELGFRF